MEMERREREKSTGEARKIGWEGEGKEGSFSCKVGATRHFTV
jgi:hypothetical protein